MKQLICCMLAVTFVTVASAQVNPLAKASNGDWAKYLITSKYERVPLMGGKDRPYWWVISLVGNDFVRIDNYTTMFGGRRSGAGGDIKHPSERFEPVPGIAKSTPVKVVTTSKEKLTIKGKQYDCTKIVRDIDQPLDQSKVQSSWAGTSTLWICQDLPLGLAKMENVYQTKLSASDKGDKITETWILDEFGFKNWK